MEKLAADIVDLDKVLDEFEKSEEEHQISFNQSSSNNTIKHNYNIPHLISSDETTLENTDFEVGFDTQRSAGSCSVQSNTETSDYSTTAYYECSIENNGFPTNESSEVVDKNKEFKLDLIEVNRDMYTHLDQAEKMEIHLPDVTTTDTKIMDEKNELDLISRVDDMKSPDMKTTFAEIMAFPTSTDIPDSELYQYLDELDENLELIPKPSKDMQLIKNSIAKIRIDVPCESSEKYVEKSEIEVNSNSDLTKNMCENQVNIENISESIANTPTTLSLNITTGVTTTVNIVDDFKLMENGNIELQDDEKINLQQNDNSSNEEVMITIERNNVLTLDTADVSTDHEKSNNIITEHDYNEHFNNKNSDEVVSVSDSHNMSDTQGSTAMEREILSNDGNINTNLLENQSELSSIDDACTSIASDDSNATQIIEDYNEQPQATRENTIVDFPENDSQTTFTENNNTNELNIYNSIHDLDESASANKITRPDTLNLLHTVQQTDIASISTDSSSLASAEERQLGRKAPIWMKDSETIMCLKCKVKFTLVKRRHHCRACGLVLCSKCCNHKAHLEYMKFEEARVCSSCFDTIKNTRSTISARKPNPNNPMEYCSKIPPHLQVGPTPPKPPSVLVPVLKREGRIKSTGPPKQVIFNDGIRPGGDLSEPNTSITDQQFPPRRRIKRVSTPPGNVNMYQRMMNPDTRSLIPSTQEFPPVVTKIKGESIFSELEKPMNVNDVYKFAINFNLFVSVKRIILDCCVNREAWCFTTEGLSCVGQDEIVFILEVLLDEKYPPKDVLYMVNILYHEASTGRDVREMTFRTHQSTPLFGSRDHSGFLFIRPTYQCTQKLILPDPPFLFAILVHRWEIPWARMFPLRLILRLGAEYRYYPCPLVSIRNRAALYTETGSQFFNLLVDIRHIKYSLPTVRGLVIHMEDRITSVLLPRNRYDEVMRAMNSAEMNMLAFAGNMSISADSHLVCMQSLQDDSIYSTQAININNKPRKITGASFIVFGGSLKQSGWTGKSKIIEDGIKVEIPSESMSNLRNALKQMQDYSIGCGPHSEETVILKWSQDDADFNVGVNSCIDTKPLDGIPSIRVHKGTDYSGSTRKIRWTEVFIIKSDDNPNSKTSDTVNVSRLADSIARATCVALLPLLDLLAAADLTTLAIRANVDADNVGYEAGSRGEPLPPLYTESLDNEVITIINQAALSIRDISQTVVLELIFKIMELG